MSRWLRPALAIALAAYFLFLCGITVFATDGEHAQNSEVLSETSVGEPAVESVEPKAPEEELPNSLLEEVGENQPAKFGALPEQQPLQGNQPENEIRICDSMDAFVAELQKDNGGAIGFSGEGPFVLKNDPDAFWTEIVVTQPVAIHMPVNGLELEEGASICFKGPVTFLGEQGITVNGASLMLFQGAAVKVRGGTAVTLCGCGRLCADSTVELQSEGDNAAALLCLGRVYLYLNYAKVKAFGNDATALFSDSDIILHHAYLEASGDGSRALYCDGEAELCQVSVSGEAEADRIFSVFNHFSQEPQNLSALAITQDSIPAKKIVYQHLSHGCSSIEFPERISCTFFYEREYSDEVQKRALSADCTVAWDLQGLDYSIPGVYTATANLQPIMPFGDSPMQNTMEITVVPQDKAAIYQSFSAPPADYGDGQYVAVQLLAPIPDAQDVVFWVYEQETGWRELRSSGQAVYTDCWKTGFHPAFQGLEGPFIQVAGLEKDSYYWVTVQVIGGPMEGFSNLWRLYTKIQNNGDRTGTDRGGAEPSSRPRAGSTTEQDEPSGGDSSEPEKDKEPTSMDTGTGTSHDSSKGSSANTLKNDPSALSDVCIQEPLADKEPETAQTLQGIREKGNDSVMVMNQQPFPADEPFDPEQSAPERKYPSKTLTVFLIIGIAFCVCGLLCFRFGSIRRWRRGKT